MSDPATIPTGAAWDWASEIMEAEYRRCLGHLGGCDHRLAAALRHVTGRPGSLVRANLCHLLSLDLGLEDSTAKALAVGLECLHTASLIFDDLPCMDDARLRRGAPCVHVLFGESVAMLAALALVNRGYALLWQGVGSAPRERRSLAMALVDQSLGLRGLTGGQAADLHHCQRADDPRHVSFVALRKTVPLLKLAVLLPALLARGSGQEARLLHRWCVYRGLAYQALDDWKDTVGSDQTIGKSVGRDLARGRPNLVMTLGAEETARRVSRWNSLAERARDALSARGGNWRALDALTFWSPNARETQTPLSAAV